VPGIHRQLDDYHYFGTFLCSCLSDSGALPR
jgi:hypothetical protein